MHKHDKYITAETYIVSYLLFLLKLKNDTKEDKMALRVNNISRKRKLCTCKCVYVKFRYTCTYIVFFVDIFVHHVYVPHF